MIVTFTMFDVRNFTTALSTRTLFALLFVLVIGVTAPIQGAAIMCGAIVTAVFASYFFQADERGRLDVLYALSAASRTAVVIGRYLATLILGIVITAAGVVVTLLSSLIRHQDLNWPLIATLLLIAYGVIAVTVAAQMPWFFAVGFTKGRGVISVFLVVIGLLGWIAGQTSHVDGFNLTTLTATPLALVVGIVVIAGALLLAVSAAIASRLYNNREL